MYGDDDDDGDGDGDGDGGGDANIIFVIYATKWILRQNSVNNHKTKYTVKQNWVFGAIFIAPRQAIWS